jgi:hypothetical protein
MKNQISKARFAALAVGIAIVMSSCGIQNQAGDSSSAPAGKTNNAALTSEWCQNVGAGIPINLDERIDLGYTRRQWADRWENPRTRARYRWVDGKTRITDVYGPDIVKCSSITVVSAAGAGGATSAAELPQAFVENSTANQCISVENRKKTLREYDEQIMAHSLDADKTIYEQMKTSRWVTTVQRPCDEPAGDNSFSKLACVSVSHKAFEVAFYNEQYELYKDQAGTPYLDLIIIGKEKANALITC